MTGDEERVLEAMFGSGAGLSIDQISIYSGLDRRRICKALMSLRSKVLILINREKPGQVLFRRETPEWVANPDRGQQHNDI